MAAISAHQVRAPPPMTQLTQKYYLFKSIFFSFSFCIFDGGSCPLTSFTPAPCRQHCDLLAVMWSSAEVLEDESSPWLSGSLSLSSMEVNTALSIQTDRQQNTEQGLLSLTPLSPRTSYTVCPVPFLSRPSFLYLRCYPALGLPGSCCCSIHCLL